MNKSLGITKANQLQAGIGVYTIPEAARILKVAAGDAAPPIDRLRRWVSGYRRAQTVHHPAGELAVWKIDGARAFSFHTLVETFVVGLLRESGVSMRTIRKAREDLADRFMMPHPFATSGLLSDGEKILFQVDEDSLLRLDKTGVQEFRKIVEDFCKKIEFDEATDLAARIRPLGRDSDVLIDPDHSFGRPVIWGTNILTETIYAYLKGGERKEDVAGYFELTVSQVEEAEEFESLMQA